MADLSVRLKQSKQHVQISSKGMFRIRKNGTKANKDNNANDKTNE